MANIRRWLAGNPLLRRIALKALRLISWDVTIRNPWSAMPIRLNAYMHKGYWYYRRDRENQTMTLFEKLIHPGATVIEVGGHIGFISQYLSNLAGPDGQVVVFEPGTNNLPYITRNIAGCANIRLERMAISDKRGTAIFYEDNITGQNNSLLPDYVGADGVSRTHGEELIRTPNEVQVISLDDYLAQDSLRPDFVKIDIEGFEFQALRGMSRTLANLDGLMVEVTHRQEEVSDLLKSHGFLLYNEACEQMSELEASFAGNVFAVRNSLTKPS